MMKLRYILLFFLLLVTVYSRFLNLDWDDGWGFHPDENNLWGASRRVELFKRSDPEFYAYGGFPVYLYSLLSNKVEARAVSAGLQTLTVGLLFVLGKRFGGWRAGLFSGMMGVFSAGLVQAGHFLTVESLLGLFSLMIIWCLLNYQELLKVVADRASISVNTVNFWLVAAASVLGLGVATKLSFVALILPLILILLRFNLWYPKVEPLESLKILKLSATFGLLVLISGSMFFLTNPYILNKWSDVWSTLEYEAKVATGNLPVFYTRQFLGTVPGWFQAAHVFPYITGWLFLPMVFVGLIVFFKVRSWAKPRSDLLILPSAVVAALLSFLPFWAKWTRYAVQVLPILILVAGIGAGWIWEKGKIGKAIVIAAVISFLPQFFSTLNVYTKSDTRIAAAKWAELNISKNSKIFTEAMDLGILPFNPAFGQNIKLFNFYELDGVRANEKQAKLDSLINESDYFILLSRRVYKNSLDHPDKFPLAAEFYRRLFDGSLGYKEIYESITPSSLFPLPSSLYFPEETFEVFDNPKVVIFEKGKA